MYWRGRLLCCGRPAVVSDDEQKEKIAKYMAMTAEDLEAKINKAIEVDTGLTKEKDEVIVPSTEKWRSEVEKVFEGLGMALDLERVERMAQATMAQEQSQGGGMMSAKEKMDKEIAAINARMNAEIDYIRNNAKALIAQIEADESLSRAEKEIRIRAIRKQADRAVQQLVMKTKRLISDQYTSGHKLDEEIHELNALLERAKLLMHSGTPEGARWAKAMMREAKAKLDQIRHRYAQDYSLAQTNSSDGGAALDEGASDKSLGEASFVFGGGKVADLPITIEYQEQR